MDIRNILKSTTKIIGDFIMLRFSKTAIGEVIIKQTFEENGRPEENEYLIEIGKAFIFCLYTGMGKRVFVMDTSKEITPELLTS